MSLKPEEFKTINENLIKDGFLNAAAVDDLETFGPASRAAYGDWLANHGIATNAPSGTLVPEHINDVPAELLSAGDESDAEADEEEVTEEVTDAEEEAEEESEEATDEEEEAAEEESSEEESEEESDEESDEEGDTDEEETP